MTAASRSVALPLLRDLTLQKGSHFGFAIAPMPAERPDRAQLPGFRPSRYGLRVDTEHRRDLGRCE